MTKCWIPIHEDSKSFSLLFVLVNYENYFVFSILQNQLSTWKLHYLKIKIQHKNRLDDTFLLVCTSKRTVSLPCKAISATSDNHSAVWTICMNKQ